MQISRRGAAQAIARLRARVVEREQLRERLRRATLALQAPSSRRSQHIMGALEVARA